MINDSQMNKNIINIEYINPKEKIKQLFDKIYNTLCENKEFKNFVSTNIYGEFEKTIFTVYEDSKDSNKLCIAFIEKNNSYIICIDSEEKEIKSNKILSVKKYLDACNFYSLKEMTNQKYIETKGLKEKTKQYYKTRWKKLLANYEIIMKEQDGKYIYIVLLEEKNRELKLTCTWQNYQHFIANKIPLDIDIIETRECFSKKFLRITNKYKYKKEDLEKNYETIKKDIRNLGLSLKFDKPIEKIKTGEIINEYIYQILCTYFEEKLAKQNRKEQIKLYLNNKYKLTNLYDEEAIEEINHLTKRYAIGKSTNRF